ncbi:MAG: UUP1 family membrane protein [Desulfobacterales bacterium]|nr:MAG: UUP1 family membrane protein [Desulfobacterales bacterium]
MFIPRNSRRFTIINENSVSRGYGVNVSTAKGKHQVHWSIRKTKGRKIRHAHRIITFINEGSVG